MEQAMEVEQTVKLNNNQKIIQQLSYYFGDINMMRDKFMKGYRENHDGWMPFAQLMKFRRLASLTSNPAEVIAAIDQVDGLVEISEDKNFVRRSPKFPIPEYDADMKNEILMRTLYIKGFPLTTTMDSLLKYFEEHEAENIVMRKYREVDTGEWKFKGSIYVTFHTKNDAEGYLIKPCLAFEGKVLPLLKMWRSMYIEDKRSMKELVEYLKEKNRMEQMLNNFNIDLPLGAVLMLSEVPDNVTRHEIKELFQNLGGQVAFVKMEFNTVWVRFKTENTAWTMWNVCKGQIKIGGTEIKCSVLENMSETLFLEDVKRALLNSKQRNRKNKSEKRRNM